MVFALNMSMIVKALRYEHLERSRDEDRFDSRTFLQFCR